MADLSAEEVAELRVCEAFRTVFSGPQGDIVLERLMDYCHFRMPTVTVDDDHAIDPSGMLYREGERGVYLFILERIGLAVDHGYEGDQPRPTTAKMED